MDAVGTGIDGVLRRRYHPLRYSEGGLVHQEVARYVGQDLAYVVLRETIRFKNPTDGRVVIQELRVTQVFRREDSRWRIVHRHADSQVRNPAE